MRRLLTVLAAAAVLAVLSSCAGEEPGSGGNGTEAPNDATNEVSDYAPDPHLVGDRGVSCGSADGELAALGSRLVELQLGESPSIELCLLVANTATLRAQGLMGVDSIEPFDGMLFTFDQPSSSAFWMKGTPLALVVGWFDAEGALVDVAAMEPCINQPTCPQYFSGTPYSYALELPQAMALASELLNAAAGDEVAPWKLIMSQG